MQPINTTPMDLGAAANTILNQPSAPTNPITQPAPVPFNASDYQPLPNANKYISDAFTSLIPYYTKLLQEAQGDVDLAITNLKQDYATGIRQTTESLAQATGFEQSNLDAALHSLGLTFTNEGNSLLDKLNSRGIATTEVGNGAPAADVATQGEAGYEMSNLKEDQALRAEATQRASSQKIQNMGLSAKQSNESALQKETQGIQTNQRGLQQKGEQLNQSMQQEAFTMGQTQQQNDQTQGQLAQNAANNASASGGTGGGSAGSPPPMPTPGTRGPDVNSVQNGYRWTGSSWA